MQITDMVGRQLNLPAPPKRIVSLVPSQTELLAHFKLDDEVVGITQFCVHPHQWFQSKQRIGGTKKLSFEKINTLQPDLIIANKEENNKEDVEQLARQFPVWVSDVHNFTSAIEMINQLATMLNVKQQGDALIQSIKQERFQNTPKVLPKVAYFIWNNPLMTVGNDTFIHAMLQEAGFENCFADSQRYPQVSINEIIARNPNFIFLSSEPFPFKEKHAQTFQAAMPGAKVVLVDGEYFSWYGSKMQKAFQYFKQLRESVGLTV